MNSSFRLKGGTHSAALGAIKTLAGSETIRGDAFPKMTGPDHYSFVTTREFMEANCFSDAMRAWRWMIEDDGTDEACGVEFLGEKLGDEEILFSTIAPYVQPDSYIQVFSQDDEAIWRWVFDGLTVRREFATIIFSYDPVG